MSRTLFDADDAPEARTNAPTPSRPRRDAIVPVRLTKGERDQLGEVARDLGICLSTYMRQAVLSRPLPPRRAVRPIPELNRETYHALGRLAADVNVIARHLAERRREPLSSLPPLGESALQPQAVTHLAAARLPLLSLLGLPAAVPAVAGRGAMEGEGRHSRESGEAG